jgi:hypothetical protein
MTSARLRCGGDRRHQMPGLGSRIFTLTLHGHTYKDSLGNFRQNFRHGFAAARLNTGFGASGSEPGARVYRGHSKGILGPFWYGSAGACEIQWFGHMVAVEVPAIDADGSS